MKMKNYFIGIIILIILSVAGYFIYEDLSCKKLEQSINAIELNKRCKNDTDCIRSGAGGLCGSCLNRDESQDKINRYIEISTQIWEKECFGPKIYAGCMQLTCKCENNQCTEKFGN